MKSKIKWYNDLNKIAEKWGKNRSDDLLQELSVAILEAGCSLDDADTQEAICKVANGAVNYLRESIASIQTLDVFSTQNQKNTVIAMRRLIDKVNHDERVAPDRGRLFNVKEIPFGPKQLERIEEMKERQKCGKYNYFTAKNYGDEIKDKDDE